MPATANQKIYEATIKHQVELLRFAEGQAQAVVAMLMESENELLGKISAGMAKGNDVSQLEAILASVKRRRQEVFDAIGKTQAQILNEFAVAEHDWEQGAIQGVSPVHLNLMDVPLEKLHGIVESPIAGLPLKGWLNNIAEAEATAIQRATNQAMIQGETIDQLVGRIRGTKAGNYQDGILQVTRRNAQALARTAVSHVAAGSREQVWLANQDIIRAKRWVSTLDGRTSPICQARDGKMVPIGDSQLEGGESPLDPPGALPPAHFNCRSTIVAVIDGGELAGDRPTVMDDRTRAKREADFKAEAKQRGVPVSQIRKEWADKYVGRTPAKMTYEEWLRKQPHEFQDDILGPERAALFRKGAPLDKFVDASGRRYTLDELKDVLATDKFEVAAPAIGLKAKSYLQQGFSTDKTLELIKAEFPNASTSIASINSYKSELKKLGALDTLTPMDVNPAMSVQAAVDLLESELPAGLKHAIGGQWLEVVEQLAGSPGAYAHYQAGKGVKVAASTLAKMPKGQLKQVLAHELGHMLDKQHGLKIDFLNTYKDVDAKAKWMPKSDVYYMSKDEMIAEVFAQAISPSPYTSQGLDATAFRQLFKEQIEDAKFKIEKHFPAPAASTPPPPSGAPTMPGMTAGKHQTVGSLAKALIQQGLPDDEVLAGIKAQFPEAKTGMNSIKSYKSELKKAGMTPSPSGGPTVHSSPLPEPAAAVSPASVVTSAPEVAAQTAATIEVPPGVWKKTAEDLFAKGIGTQDVVDQLNQLYPLNTKINYGNVASSKSAWKAKGGSVSTGQADAVTKTVASKGPPPPGSGTVLQGNGPQVTTKLSDWEDLKKAKTEGSNPGGFYKLEGEEYLVKGNLQLANGSVSLQTSINRAKNEVLASKLMKALNVGAPEMKLVDLQGKFGGGLGVASKIEKGIVKFDPKNAKHLAAAQEDFAVQAWLGNWDVMGASFDNTVIDKLTGKAINIDPGGSLLFRAMGTPKKLSDFGADAADFVSMRSSSPQQTAVYGKMTSEQLKKSAEKLYEISDDAIKQLAADYGPGDMLEREKLADLLIARKKSILKQAGLPEVKPGVTKPSAPTPPPVQKPAVITPAMYKEFKLTAETVAKIESEYAGSINYVKQEMAKGKTAVDMKAYFNAFAKPGKASKMGKYIDFQMKYGDGFVQQPVFTGGAPAVKDAAHYAQAEKLYAPQIKQAETFLKQGFPPASVDNHVQVLIKNTHASLSAAEQQSIIEDILHVAQNKASTSAAATSPTANATFKTATAAKPPKLFGQSLGAKSSALKNDLVILAKQGKTYMDPDIQKLFKSSFSKFDPSKGTDLWELAEWEAQGKPGYQQFLAKQSAEAKAKADAALKAEADRLARENAALVPSRPATTPREGWPPPPRFTPDAHQQGLNTYAGGLNTHKMSEINAKQRKLGLPELTQEEFSAMRSYTGGYYTRLNEALRAGKYAIDNRLQAYVDAAQSGWNKMPKRAGTTRRGMSFYGKGLEDFLNTYKQGAVVEDHAFLSTSTKTGFSGNVKMTIHGKSGVDVSSFSHYPGEAEVLFFPGTRYRVDKVVRTGDQVTIEVTEV